MAWRGKLAGAVDDMYAGMYEGAWEEGPARGYDPTLLTMEPQRWRREQEHVQ